jgi:neutral ceramidase
VGVIKIESIQGDLLAVFVNWACHGTASGQENYQITGDWPGLAARYLEKELGQETVILVTAGASGDINPIYGPNDNFREIQAVGYNLAQEVVKILPAISTSKVENLNIARKTLVLPGKKRLDSRFPPEKLEKGEDVEVRLTAAKIGHVVLTGISGEVMTEIGFQVKKGTRSEELFVVTHCNGSSGYICTDKAFPEGGYEIMVTRLMPGAEEAIVENLLDMVEGLN